MVKARDGDIVKIRYTLSLKNGPFIDSSTEQLMFEFMIGRGAVFPALESAVVGMQEGETKQIVVPPEKAYGCYYDELTYVVARDELPLDIAPEVGMQLRVSTAEGQEIDGQVTAVEDGMVTIDANHELAGKELIFEIRLLKIICPG
jgi:peptidylprolyl isomerase